MKLFTTLGLLLCLLVFALVCGLNWGSGNASLLSALNEGEESLSGRIVFDIRAPRVLLALAIGMGLSSVGAVFQGMLRNPLADPYILGVSGGASVGVVIAVALGLGGAIAGVSLLPAAAFLGALFSVSIIYTLARLLPGGIRGPYAVYTLLLAGVVFNALAMAVVMVLHSLMAPIDSQQVLFWMMGSLSVGRLSEGEYWSVILIILLGTSWLVFRSGRLNLLAMGDDVARSLGLRVGASRMLFFVISSAIVGAAVAASGMVGFVGLVVPHAIRLLLGADNRLLVPAAALGGGVFMVFSDLLSRVSFHLFHSTLPVGVVTAFVGVPCFFMFLVKGLKSRNG